MIHKLHHSKIAILRSNPPRRVRRIRLKNLETSIRSHRSNAFDHIAPFVSAPIKSALPRIMALIADDAHSKKMQGQSMPLAAIGYWELLDEIVQSVCPQEAKEHTQELITALVEFSLKVSSLGGPFLDTLQNAYENPLAFDYDQCLDNSPDQIPFHTQKAKHFGRGLIYHGMVGIDQLQEHPFIPKRAFFTRIPYVWAAADFSADFKGSIETAGIVVVNTERFNHWIDQEQAEITFPYFNHKAHLHPTPIAHGEIPLDAVDAIWLGEEAYERFGKTLQGKAQRISGLNIQSVRENTHRSGALFKYFIRHGLFRKIPIVLP